MKHIITISLCAVIAGCVSSGNMTWSKPGSGPQEFHKARAQCMSMAGPGGQQVVDPGAGSGPFATGFGRGFNQMSAALSKQQQQRIFNDCMMGHGYSLVSQQQAQEMHQQYRTTRHQQHREAVRLSDPEVARFWEDLEEKVPDYRALNDDPAFHAWLSQLDPSTGRTRQARLAKAQSQRDSKTVIMMFKRFIETRQ